MPPLVLLCRKICHIIEVCFSVNKKIPEISTHLLTVLIIDVIVQLEQRKRDKKKGS